MPQEFNLEQGVLEAFNRKIKEKPNQPKALYIYCNSKMVIIYKPGGLVKWKIS